MINCNHCGHDNLDEARFCEKCGGELVQESFCPSCGEPNDADAEFCEHCGASISGQVPPSSQTSPVPPPQSVVVEVHNKEKHGISRAWLLLLLLIPLLCFFVPDDSALGELLHDVDQIFPEDSPIGQFIPKIQNILPKISIITDPPEVGSIDSCADFQNAAKQNLSATAECAADGTTCDVIIAGAEVFALNVDVSYINHGFDTDITCKLENSVLICSVSKTKASPVPDVTVHHEIAGGQTCAYNLQPALTGQDDESVCCNRISGWFYNITYADGIFGFDLTCGDPSNIFPGFPVQQSYGKVYDKSGKYVSRIECSRQENIDLDFLICESMDAYNYADPNVTIDLMYLGPEGDSCQMEFEYDMFVPYKSSSNNGQCAPTAISTGYPFCRSGPGEGYNKKGNLEKDQNVTLVAKSGSGNWWKVQDPGCGVDCWVWGFWLDIQDDTSCLPVISGIEIGGSTPQPADPETEDPEDEGSGSEEPGDEEPGSEEPECLSPSDPACLYPECPCCRACVQF